MSNTGLGAKKRDGKGSSRAPDAGGDETRYQVEEARLKGIDSDYYEIFPDDISTGKKVRSHCLSAPLSVSFLPPRLLLLLVRVSSCLLLSTCKFILHGFPSRMWMPSSL